MISKQLPPPIPITTSQLVFFDSAIFFLNELYVGSVLPEVKIIFILLKLLFIFLYTIFHKLDLANPYKFLMPLFHSQYK